MMPDLVTYQKDDSLEKSAEDDFAVRVEDFPIHVSQMRTSRTYGFGDEFETLPEGQTASWDAALKAENMQKNRYNNILPYDHARVTLTGKSDYINASWIEGKSQVLLPKNIKINFKVTVVKNTSRRKGPLIKQLVIFGTVSLNSMLI